MTNSKEISYETYKAWNDQIILHDEDQWEGKYKTYGEMWIGEGYEVQTQNIGTDKMLYKWSALIDAEGRCENYWLNGYACIDYDNWMSWGDIRRKVLANLEADGEIVLDVKVEKAGNVISF